MELPADFLSLGRGSVSLSGRRGLLTSRGDPPIRGLVIRVGEGFTSWLRGELSEFKGTLIS